MDSSRRADRPRHPKPRTEVHPSDVPPQLSPVDIIIGLHQGSTSALETTPRRLQASKQQPIPPLSERIKELQQCNGNLRRELAHYREIDEDHREFESDMKEVWERLGWAIFKLDRVQRQLDQERSQRSQRAGANGN